MTARLTKYSRQAALVWSGLIYCLVGSFIVLYVAGVSEWKAFLAGWIIAVVNFELLRKIGSMLLSAMSGSKPSFWIYLLLVVKFAFWGGVILFLSRTQWLSGTYFVAGSMTILLSGLVLGLKEFSNKDTQYAR